MQEAREHLTLQHWEEAALAAEAALALEPDSAEAHHIAAQARLKQGMRSTAARHAERAIALDPGNPEYHATLLAAQGPSGAGSFDWSRPGVIASVAGLAVLIIVLTIGLNAMANRSREGVAITPSTPTGQPGPFTATQQPGGIYPQPTRPVGSIAGKPRVPARASAPGPADLTGGMVSNVPSMPSGGAAGMSPLTAPSAAVGLSNSPVDTTPLNRFANPEPAAPRPQGTAPPRPQPTPVVEPPSQPGGGTLFGGTGFGPDRGNSEVAANPEPTAEASAQPSTTSATAPPPPASPQQAYVQRNYGAAIQGYLRRIDQGEATGSNYLQLGLAYERVGDRQNARAALNLAAKAYQAQITSGVDTDVAARGLKTTQRELIMLGSR